MIGMQTSICRSKIEMVDAESGKRNSRWTDGADDEKHGKRRAVDVASRNETDGGKYKPYNVQQSV